MSQRRFRIPAGGGNGRVRATRAVAADLLRYAVFLADTGFSAVPGQGPDRSAIRTAERAVMAAREKWQDAWEANKRMPGVLSPKHLERLHVAMEMALARLDETRAVMFHSKLRHIGAELAELSEEVVQLIAFHTTDPSS